MAGYDPEPGWGPTNVCLYDEQREVRAEAAVADEGHEPEVCQSLRHHRPGVWCPDCQLGGPA